MKKETDLGHDITDERDITGDTAGLYNEEMARNAAKSLFDDDIKPSAEEPPQPLVTGFERPVELRAVEREPRERVYADRPSKPRVRPVDERQTDDSFGDSETPYIRRERAGSIPPPKPAVRVNVASASANPRIPQNRAVRPMARREDGEPGEDAINTFRQRYKERETGPSPRYPEPAMRVSRTPVRSLPDRDSYDDAESFGKVRWIMIGTVAASLIIIAFLVFQWVSVSGKLKELEETYANQPPADAAPDASLVFANEQLQIDLDSAYAQINTLEEQLAQRLTTGNPGGSGIITEPTTPEDGPISPPGGDPLANPVPTVPAAQTYKVVSGDTLSKIAKNFYGSASEDNIKKIQEANNITGTVIQVNQELLIP
jgi:LysM repeat protein